MIQHAERDAGFQATSDTMWCGQTMTKGCWR
jgi:hypothetical protein